MSVRISNRAWASAIVGLDRLCDQFNTEPAMRESFRQTLEELRAAQLLQDEFDTADLPALLRKQA